MTEAPSKSAAQQRADAIHVFQQELEQLARERVLTLSPEQRAAVDAHHATLLSTYATRFDIDRDTGAKQLSVGMRIASFLGALALSASVFFLFLQFWGRLGTILQITILVGASLGTFAATLAIHKRDASGYFTNLAAMIALACFVLNISMVGSIFNITPTDNAFIAWGAYALLLAYVCDLRLLLAAGIACVFAFISARMATWSGIYWIYFGERPENFFLPSLLLFLVPQFVKHDRRPSFPPVYRMLPLIAAFISVLILSNWGRGSYLTMDRDTIEAGYQWVGFAGSAVMAWLGVRQGWKECVNVGVTFFVIFLYTKLFDWWWDTMPKYLFFLVLGLTAILILTVLRRVRRTGMLAFGGATS